MRRRWRARRDAFGQTFLFKKRSISTLYVLLPCFSFWEFASDTIFICNLNLSITFDGHLAGRWFTYLHEFLSDDDELGM
jgi:hypothetical protein